MAEIQKFINEHPVYSIVVFIGLLLALAILTISAVFLLMGKPSEERVLGKLQGVEILNLEIEAETIWSDSNNFRIVEKDEWPKEATKFDPKSIYVDQRWGVFFEVIPVSPSPGRIKSAQVKTMENIWEFPNKSLTRQLHLSHFVLSYKPRQPHLQVNKTSG